MGLDDHIFAGVIGAVIVALVFLCARIPKNKAIAIVTCIGIFVWFFLGFSVAGLRIT